MDLPTIVDAITNGFDYSGCHWEWMPGKTSRECQRRNGCGEYLWMPTSGEDLDANNMDVSRMPSSKWMSTNLDANKLDCQTNSDVQHSWMFKDANKMDVR